MPYGIYVLRIYIYERGRPSIERASPFVESKSVAKLCYPDSRSFHLESKRAFSTLRPRAPSCRKRAHVHSYTSSAQTGRTHYYMHKEYTKRHREIERKREKEVGESRAHNMANPWQRHPATHVLYVYYVDSRTRAFLSLSLSLCLSLSLATPRPTTIDPHRLC